MARESEGNGVQTTCWVDVGMSAHFGVKKTWRGVFFFLFFVVELSKKGTKTGDSRFACFPCSTLPPLVVARATRSHFSALPAAREAAGEAATHSIQLRPHLGSNHGSVADHSAVRCLPRAAFIDGVCRWPRDRPALKSSTLRARSGSCASTATQPATNCDAAAATRPLATL